MADRPEKIEEGEYKRDRVVIEPRVSKFESRVHDPVVLCPVGFMIKPLAKMLKARKSLRPFEPASIHVVTSNGRKATIAGPCMGAPAAVFTLERLIAAGARNIVLLGLCGSISPQVKIGDIVIPMGARIEEGTSLHYVRGTKKAFPSEKALEAVKTVMAGYGKSHHYGPVWTTDAPFRETRDKVSKYAEKGLLAVEMETSALFTLAAYRGVNLAAVLVVSDELFDLKWRTGFTRPRFLSSVRHAGRLALAAAMAMAGEDATPALPDDGIEEGDAEGGDMDGTHSGGRAETDPDEQQSPDDENKGD